MCVRRIPLHLGKLYYFYLVAKISVIRSWQAMNGNDHKHNKMKYVFTMTFLFIIYKQSLEIIKKISILEIISRNYFSSVNLAIAGCSLYRWASFIHNRISIGPLLHLHTPAFKLSTNEKLKWEERKIVYLTVLRKISKQHETIWSVFFFCQETVNQTMRSNWLVSIIFDGNSNDFEFHPK